MKTPPQNQAIGTSPATPHPDAERVAAPRNDVQYLSAYAAAAREIFVSANGLPAYYRTYYKSAGEAGWGAGSRQGDWGQAVWRQGPTNAMNSPPAAIVKSPRPGRTCKIN